MRFSLCFFLSEECVPCCVQIEPDEGAHMDIFLANTVAFTAEFSIFSRAAQVVVNTSRRFVVSVVLLRGAVNPHTLCSLLSSHVAVVALL